MKPNNPDVESLNGLDAKALRDLWKKTFRSESPPRAKRILLIRLLAYGLQEQTFGSLPKTRLMQLDAFARPRPRAQAHESDSSPPLGLQTRLMRDWGGRAHEVTVCETGFSYDGKSYRSLTQIARVITGAHWSGPRFFGVASRPKAGRAA